MPHINSRGEVAHGVAGGYCNLNNVQVALGGVLGWWDDDTIAFFNGNDDWKASLYHVPTKTIKRIDETFGGPVGGRVGNHGFAFNGRAAWWGPGGITTTWGFASPSGGLLGMCPTGAIIYKPDYQSMGPTMYREINGLEFKITDGSVDKYATDTSVCGVGPGQFVYEEGCTPHAQGLPPLSVPPGPQWGSRAAYAGGEYWFACYHGTYGIILHPFNSLVGFQVLQGEGWWTMRAMNERVIRFAICRDIGEQAGGLYLRDYDVVANAWCDPWATTPVWQPVARKSLVDIVPPAKPVTPFAPFPRKLWLGYYKVTGRNGNHLRAVSELGTNVALFETSDYDSSWTDTQKRSAFHEDAQTAITYGLKLIGGTTRESIDLFRPYWAHVAYVQPPVVSEDAGAVEAAIAEYDAVLKEYNLPRHPVAWYVDAELTNNYRRPKGVDIQALNMYVGPPYPSSGDAALAELRNKWARQQAKLPNDIGIILVAQAYDRNGQWTNLPALKDLQSGYAEFIKDSRLKGIWWFSYGRSGGTLAHPELLEWHREYVRANPGTPEVIAVPWPTPPIPPIPPIPPVDPPVVPPVDPPVEPPVVPPVTPPVTPPKKGNPRKSILQKILYWLGLWR